MSKPEVICFPVSERIGHYADAVRVPPGYELILVLGTPGLDENGALADNITDQARQA
ncbi:hypothetical protein [Streptomyces sp. 6-11-2]|uniref:hypothetical protein n=1 Tax=Streptomyces sp. 6-11-2 TaxID=2585753 RepID=UPI00116EC1F2|nr:hypothetical protein [Streptomyces sp. 6-11-2]GED88756.1 hypothetical protein TNCT6_58410 [Streptomyces sp. 6-11-2]